MPVVNGIDTDSDTTSVISCLVANNIAFVGRYYCAETSIPGKKLTLAEAQALSQTGIQIAALYEENPSSIAYFTAQQGTADATAALAQAAALGQPAGSAIYFTIDYDPTDADIAGGITIYFQAVSAQVGSQYAVGVYGCGAACAALLGSGLARYAWLSNSSSFNGTSTFTGWSIRQSPPTSICNGFPVDPDIAQAGYGGFRLS
jgi:hypothetical protein